MCFTLGQNFYTVGIAFAVEQAVNDHFVGGHLAFNAAGGADDQGPVAGNFTFDITIYLDVAA